MSTLYYQGHGSFRITTNADTVIYVDPYAGDGYSLPADIILITHEHSDHNKTDIVPKKNDCKIITDREAQKDGKYNSFIIKDTEIHTVSAYNKNHKKDSCVGYILQFDNISLYASGDTSKTEDMESLSSYHLNYALLPIDGIYNMDAKEAAECADLIGALHNIPIHMKPGVLFDREKAETFKNKNRLIVAAGEEITL